MPIELKLYPPAQCHRVDRDETYFAIQVQALGFATKEEADAALERLKTYLENDVKATFVRTQ